MNLEEKELQEKYLNGKFVGNCDEGACCKVER